jgi:hypothetical protein
LQRIEESKVESPIDEDAGARDDEPPIEAPDPVRPERLDVAVDDAVKLPIPARLCVHRQPERRTQTKYEGLTAKSGKD